MNENRVVQRRRIGDDNHAGERLLRKRIASLAIMLEVGQCVMQIHVMRLQERMNLHPGLVTERSLDLSRREFLCPVRFEHERLQCGPRKIFTLVLRSGHAIELIPELYERFSTLKHCHDCRPRHLNEASQARVRCIAARDQDDLRRWAMSFQQLDKVVVFGQDDDVCTASGGKDLAVGRTLKVQIANWRQSIESVARIHPASAGGS